MVTSLAAGCDDPPAAGARAATRPAATVIFDAAGVPAGFVTHRHASEDLVIRAPADWRYMEQPFREQNDVLVGLFPPGSVPAKGGPMRLYVHGHVLPKGVSFNRFLYDHEFGSFATDAGQTFLASEPARLNGLAAHRWVSAGRPPAGPKSKRLMIAAVKGETVYYAEFRAVSPGAYERFAPVVQEIISSLTIGEPTPWPSPPPPPRGKGSP